MIGLPVAYKPMSASGIVKSRGGEVYGWITLESSAGTITVYDNTAASGNIIAGPITLVAGDQYNFGWLGIKTSNGIYVAIGGTATLNFLYN